MNIIAASRSGGVERIGGVYTLYIILAITTNPSLFPHSIHLSGSKFDCFYTVEFRYYLHDEPVLAPTIDSFKLSEST